jgi:hypothetical protein
MPRPRFHRPSPALVLSVMAVFASLGGTGIAASRLAGGSDRADAAKTRKPLTKSQINKLIASYVKKHRSQLRGPAGAPGTQGTQGIQGVAGANGHDGAAGPGATRIEMHGSSTDSTTQPVATVGPWSFTLTCKGSAHHATLEIDGPGTATSATSIAIGASNGVVRTSAPADIGSGWILAVDDGAQAMQTLYLRNGSTLVQVNVMLSAFNGGLFETCDLVGAAIPVT